MELDDKELEKLKELVPYKILSPTPQEIIAEIERLNNIINELEKYIDEDDWTSVNGEIAIRLIKLKLQELKGSDKE